MERQSCPVVRTSDPELYPAVEETNETRMRAPQRPARLKALPDTARMQPRHDSLPPCVRKIVSIRKLIFTVAKAKKIEDLQTVFNAF